MTDTAKAPTVVPYEFSRDWFTGNIPTWRQVVDKNKPRKILEIGSFEGRSTVWMVEYCSIAAALPVDETRAGLPGKPAEDRPVPHLAFGHENHRSFDFGSCQLNGKICLYRFWFR